MFVWGGVIKRRGDGDFSIDTFNIDSPYFFLNKIILLSRDTIYKRTKLLINNVTVEKSMQQKGFKSFWLMVD